MFACQAWSGVQHKAVCRHGLVVKSLLGGKVLGVVFPNFELDDQDLYCSVHKQVMQLSKHPLLGWVYLRLYANNQVITPLRTWLLRESKEVCLVWDEESFAKSKASLERVPGFSPRLYASKHLLSLLDTRVIDCESITNLPEEVEIFNSLAFKIKKLEYLPVYGTPTLSLARLDTTDLEDLTFYRTQPPWDFSSFCKLKSLCIIWPSVTHPFRIVADNLCELRLTNMDKRAMPELPLWLFEMQHLETLVLTLCSIGGSIPSWVGKLTKLKHLELRCNHLCGELPVELEQLSLKTLILSHNKDLSGDIKLQSTTSYNFDGTNVRRVEF
jgi:hypothetical protein